MKQGKLGRLIRAERVYREWSMRALAEKVNVSQPTISRWESGERMPRADELARLEKVFDLEFGYFATVCS